MDILNKYTISLFFFSLLWTYLGVKTLLRDYRNKIYILFCLICLSMIIPVTVFGFIYALDSFENWFIWIKIAYIGIYFFFPLNLHFYILISKVKIKQWLIAAYYAPAVILNISNFLGYGIFSELCKRDGIAIGVFDKSSIALYFYFCAILVHFFLSCYVLYKWKKRTGMNKEKIYSNFILIFQPVIYVVPSITTIILPYFEIYSFQVFGIICFQMYVGGLYILILKYRFININYRLMAEEIISNINDVVILMNHDMKIIQVNGKFGQLLSIDGSSIINKNYYDLIIEAESLKDKLKELAGNKTGNITMRITYRKKDEYVITNTYISIIKDKFGDAAGYFIISSEVKEIAQFRKYFKITNRELELIELIISGSTYREASDRLRITENTVETHMSNIYNKLGINNKIELIRITGEFNIHPIPQN